MTTTTTTTTTTKKKKQKKKKKKKKKRRGTRHRCRSAKLLHSKPTACGAITHIKSVELHLRASVRPTPAPLPLPLLLLLLLLLSRASSASYHVDKTVCGPDKCVMSLLKIYGLCDCPMKMLQRGAARTTPHPCRARNEGGNWREEKLAPFKEPPHQQLSTALITSHDS